MVALKDANELFDSLMCFPSKKARWFSSNRSKKWHHVISFRKYTSKHILCSVCGSLTVGEVSCSNACSPMERPTRDKSIHSTAKEELRVTCRQPRGGCVISEVNSRPSIEPWMTSWFQSSERLEPHSWPAPWCLMQESYGTPPASNSEPLCLRGDALNRQHRGHLPQKHQVKVTSRRFLWVPITLHQVALTPGVWSAWHSTR